ncbi:hypothetical protein CEUSTIGMA_g5190.t1 [Chlamydomonas eustigma]|uniref:Major facilitator superfamily (MFS) profile domain-containing protein n=1 Tax=Chlamydomonas eustigma TaxID=1157962 RepID=A0A250X3U5_9CHLO|nr:hypothetical protein CEUSTIGMA_g5190.t1 [Chlamydomonas eustigma]|eukprot:GAX77747.1 hypothetical protein CEUSTIGMA_g5190.t1 [Chlamydomonas eustigma]
MQMCSSMYYWAQSPRLLCKLLCRRSTRRYIAKRQYAITYYRDEKRTSADNNEDFLSGNAKQHADISLESSNEPIRASDSPDDRDAAELRMNSADYAASDDIKDAHLSGTSLSDSPSKVKEKSTQSVYAALASVDAEDYEPRDFPLRRLLCFVGITAGYMGLYFTRGSLTYCAPVLLADSSLGITITDIGALTSAFPVAYGISKFAGGVLGARYSARLMLGGGLLLTAMVNLTFGFCSSVTAFAALWFLNGSLQGVGAPASAALLTRWFASKERGTYWGLWNTGANMGGFLTPLIVGWAANHWGWQWGMWVPGAIGLTLALFCLAAVKDSPELAGYSVPSRQKIMQAAQNEKSLSAGMEEKDNTGMAMREAFKEVVRNRGIWFLASTYFFVYIVRQGATSWLMMYLIQCKGVENAAQAAVTVSGLELGGLVGGTLAGVLSDARIREASAEASLQSKTEGGQVGRRVQIIMGYLGCTLLVLAGLKHVPTGFLPVQWLVIAALGFTIYGPHMLIGLCGAELVSKPAVTASQGLLGIVAYFGAANAGIPLSHILQHSGWDGYFMAMTVACICALLLLLPLVNSKSYIQEKMWKGERSA